jgi:hypothetical protein
MFKKLFFYLLKRYSRTEKDRLKILSELDKNVHIEYNEQTEFGNVYNFYIEFILSNKFIKTLVKDRDSKNLTIIHRGLNKTFIESINFIEKEQL